MIEKENNIKLLVLRWITVITNLWFSIAIENFWFIYGDKVSASNGNLIFIMILIIFILPILSFIIFDYIFKKVHWVMSILIMLPMWYAIKISIMSIMLALALH